MKLNKLMEPWATCLRQDTLKTWFERICPYYTESFWDWTPLNFWLTIKATTHDLVNKWLTNFSRSFPRDHITWFSLGKEIKRQSISTTVRPNRSIFLWLILLKQSLSMTVTHDTRWLVGPHWPFLQWLSIWRWSLSYTRWIGWGSGEGVDGEVFICTRIKKDEIRGECVT